MTAKYQNIVDIINGRENKDEKIALINILLVYMGLRRGALLENVSLKDAKKFSSLLEKNKELAWEHSSLYKFKIWKSKMNDNVFVSHFSYNEDNFDNQTLGYFLGYRCATHVDTITNRERRSIIDVKENYYNVNIYSQYCNPEKKDKSFISYQLLDDRYETVLKEIAEDVEVMNTAMRKYQLPYNFSFEINIDPGLDERLENMNNIQYIKDNIYYYINDLYNQYFSTSRFITDENNIYKYHELFKFIYFISNNELWNSNFEDIQFSSLEQKLFNSNKKDWIDIIKNYSALNEINDIETLKQKFRY